MRALAIPLAFIAMTLFAVTTNVSKLNYGGNDWVDGMPLAPVSVKICILRAPPAPMKRAVLETAVGVACARLEKYSLRFEFLG